MSQKDYVRIWDDPLAVRRYLDDHIVKMPEIFPQGMIRGYRLSGRLPASKKMPGIRLRQIRLSSGGVYTLRPSFVMCYMTGSVEQVEHALLLSEYGVPYWIITLILGRNDMYWYRHVERLGRNSLVGTTVQRPDALPEHLVADEHHADWYGQKGYVAFTVGDGCILGAALSPTADEKGLKKAYGTFSLEARAVDPKYSPETVNIDGWTATRNSFLALFAGITTVLCFLHGFLKIRDRGRKLHDLHEMVWNVYRSENADEFREKMGELFSWCSQANLPEPVHKMVKKLRNRSEDYAVSYDHPGCHRTSNMVDRLMNRLTRYLYAGRGLHGHKESSELRLRGWALLHNFRPYAPRSGEPRQYQSPAHRLNGKTYHEHWLHNLQISASMQGIRWLT